MVYCNSMHETPHTLHQKFMQIALNLARRGIGNTAENPTVGCVVVHDGIILSEGRTAKNGRPHAESVALDNINAKGASIYVTLEPCSHHGKTPPCAEKIIKAKPAEVVVACTDPDPRVNGKGIKMLRDAGIKVTTGICEKEALQINRGFFKRIKTGMPFVTLKAAISADGKYASGNGKPVWVTGELARNYVHLLRSRADALITGTGTVLADNPQLNVRISGLEDTSPQVIVVGKSKVNLQKNWQQKTGALKTILQDLGANGTNNLLIEAGSTLANAFIKAGLVDELIIIQSPKNLGKNGVDYFEPNATKSFKQISAMQLGDDKIITLCPKI
jgi:diaminohydroxyphosphoribosylaminopyrimidine deaminase/5-amino-6-(5-phosphoribosylamino)uracil reductase